MRRNGAMFCALLLSLFLPAVAQDTLAPGMTNYADILDDWKDQDSVARVGYRQAVQTILARLSSPDKAALQQRFSALAGVAADAPEMIALYTRVCSARRASRMAPYLNRFQKVIFSQHTIHGTGYFLNGTYNGGGYEGKGLELLQMKGQYGSVAHLMPTGEGMTPDISFDGNRVLFSYRDSKAGLGSYNLWELNLTTGTKRQLTFDVPGLGEGNAVYEGIYLPNGNILFNSTRIMQRIDCTMSEQAGNMFLCDKDGLYPRRIGFDQVMTNYPQVLPSGEIVYCRWDYNDKSHVHGHALFVMKPDGTAQREFYNNNSLWPTMILQERHIPGTNKVMAMLGGYHQKQQGKIGIIDNSIGMENGLGVTLLCPVRQPKDDSLDSWGGAPANWSDAAVFPRPGRGPSDGWGGDPPVFAYPYPFDEQAFLVSFRPASKETAWGTADRFGLYFMMSDGQREMLYFDPQGSCLGAVVVAPRQVPILSSTVDYRKSTGTFQIMDIYQSQDPVLKNIPRGTITRLRVAYLIYRAYVGVGSALFDYCNVPYFSGGVPGAIATGNASWDCKGIIGETPVQSDGSASFTVPARTPIYFQALDSKGQVVQTMRSWTTLQPGETFACMGCHESKLSATPPLSYVPIAMKTAPLALEPFYGPQRGYSFPKEVQPILDAKCVRCHSAATPNGINLEGASPTSPQANDRLWSYSYLNLVKHNDCDNFSPYVSWFHAEASPLLQPPYIAGSSKSPLMPLLEQGHKGVTLTKEELDKIRSWIDLGVPFSGNNNEDVANPDTKKLIDLYMGFAGKTFGQADSASIAALIRATASAPFARFSPTPGAQANRPCMIKSGRLFLNVPAEGGQQVRVQVRLYDLRGACLKTLTDGLFAPGQLRLEIDGQGRSPLPAGRYVARIRVGGVETVAGVGVME